MIEKAKDQGNATHWLYMLVLVGLFLPLPIQAQSKDLKEEKKRCYQKYRKKFFLQSARCYEALRERKKEPRFLVQIAQSYRLAALNQLSQKDANTLREKAIKALLQYKKEAPQANFWSDGMIAKLRKLIGYAKVALSTKPADANFMLTGPNFRKAGKMPFAAQLQPGKYTIRLAAKGHIPKEESFEVQPRSLKTQQWELTKGTAPAPKPKAKVAVAKPIKKRALPPPKGKGPGLLPWVTAGAAGALVITGVVFVGLAAGNQGQIANPDTSARQARDALYQSGWQTPTGWTFVGVGVAAGAGAAFLFFLPRNNNKKQAALPRTSHTTYAHIE